MVESRIRTASLDDAEAIAPLLGQLGYPTTAEQARQRLHILLADPRYAVLVAECECRVLGCAGLERRFSLDGGESAELMTLVIAADARRSGIGHALLRAAENRARELGFAALQVRSNVLRAESHPFYLKHGFVPQKTQHVYAKRITSD